MIAQRLKKSTALRANSKTSFSLLLKQYLAYCNAQKIPNVLWYMKVILVIPCVFMVPSIMAMSVVTDAYEYYVGFTILLFYANVIVHIAGLKGRTFVPLYHVSLALLVLIPVIAALIFGTSL